MTRPEPHETPAVVDESAWMAVISKMDEVYSQLIADEVELERKNAELEEQQRFILGLLTAMSDVLLACNDEGRIEETNRALCELVGRPHTSLQGTAVHELLADEAGRHQMQAVMARCRKAGGDAAGGSVELSIIDSRGQPVPVDFNCSPRRDAAGRRSGFVLVGRPLGELQRAYRQLRESHAALKQAQQQLVHSEKMASLGRLVAGVAHELNNPISFVLGNVQALQRYGQRLQGYFEAEASTSVTTPAERQALRQRWRIDRVLADLPSLIDGMSEGAQRTADIVDGLRRFSVVDPQERVELDLRDVVDRAIHWMRKGSAPDFAVNWQPPAEPCRVWGSAGQLLQVFMNLIQNAAQACQGTAGGALTIRIDTDAQNRWLVCFDDNGPGIAPQDLGRVFDPFFTTKPVGEGTGLGLSISHGIVLQHGGQLGVEASASGGARFLVHLPRRKAEP